MEEIVSIKVEAIPQKPTLNVEPMEEIVSTMAEAVPQEPTLTVGPMEEEKLGEERDET